MMSKFPSPYGVSFILIKSESTYSFNDKFEFPSPYGVLFILIRKELKLNFRN